MDYRAPLDHMRFLLELDGGMPRLRQLPAYAEVSTDVVDAVLEGAARFAGEVLAPLNATGDRHGSKVTDAGVRTPPGFRDAYRRFAADGWAGLAGNPEFGGQGMPQLLAAAVGEMWSAANVSFALCPELGLGAIEALDSHGSEALKAEYLPKLLSGEWTGTMCLTEPQAGSDLSTLTTRAEPDGDRWRLHGRKIYITWGEHDMADNVVHLVLARTPDAPPGVRGISLFLVPRFLPDAGGRWTVPNDVRAVSVEHKMGIHASPTCVMSLGDGPGAVGWLIGERHQGLACMFTMMNYMRLGVGIQGVGIADAAYQLASKWARERVQGRGHDGRPTAIIAHADVRRMLLAMKSQAWAARGVAYAQAVALDVAKHGASDAERAAATARADLLTPIVKAWATDVAIEVTSLGVQVHGGAGFTEDSGAAQLYRDARITAIYEGTNYIQAQDLLGRKVLRDGGRALGSLLDEVRAAAKALPGGDPRAAALGRALADALDRVEEATRFVLERSRDDRELAGAVAVPYLHLVGYTLGGWQWALALAAAARDAGGTGPRAAFARSLYDAAGFYAAHVLPRARLNAATLLAGSEPVVEVDAEYL